jgi:undecaprenyl-phosphate 4-deoxy-4-formamido-L-arabinose transferase
MNNLDAWNARHPVDVSVVVPVYNSEDTLEQLIERLSAVFAGMNRSFEVVFVEDGSRDRSWEVLERIQAAHGDVVTAVQLMRNFGQHNALMCGFRHCRGAYVITMDDDLQNPPEEVPRLLRAIEDKGLDLVYGVEADKHHESWRNLGSAVTRYFYRTVFKSHVSPTSFRVIRRALVDSVLTYDLNYTYVDGLLAWNTQRVGTVEVEHHARESGRSGYSLSKLLLLAFNLFTNFSLLPLQFVSLCGFLAALAGFAVGGFYVAQYFLANIAVPGFASIIVAVLVLGGMQLLALGIMGEYLGRLHINVNRKPQYTVRTALLGGKALPMSRLEDAQVVPISKAPDRVLEMRGE